MAYLSDGDVYTNGKSGSVIVIEQDTDCESPRTSCETNLGTFLTWDRKYSSPDENPYETVIELGEDYDIVCHDNPWSFCNSFAAMDLGVAVPVWAFEHGPVEYAIDRGNPAFERHGNPFGDGLYAGFDSRPMGVIFATKEQLADSWDIPVDEIDPLNPEVWSRACDEFDVEVEIYTDWANGECHGYVEYDLATGDQLESGWGFIGDDSKKSGIEGYTGKLVESSWSSLEDAMLAYDAMISERDEAKMWRWQDDIRQVDDAAPDLVIHAMNKGLIADGDVPMDVGAGDYIYALSTDTETYEYLSELLGGERAIIETARDAQLYSSGVPGESDVLYFHGGGNYDVYDADLLGGNGSGLAAKAFTNYCDAMRARDTTIQEYLSSVDGIDLNREEELTHEPSRFDVR